MTDTQHVVADADNELTRCLREFRALVNVHERVSKLWKNWDRDVIVEATDTGNRVFMNIANAHVEFTTTQPSEGEGTLHLRGAETVLSAVFSGKRSAVRAFLDAELEVFASDSDQTKLEATCMIIWGK